MRKLIIPLLLSLSAASAFAAGQTSADVRDYAGAYVLADGRVLTVGDDNGHLTAQIASAIATGRNARFSTPKTVVLRELAPARFISISTPLEISFDHAADGAVAHVRMNEQVDPMRAVAGR